jgi:hypothetical protein
VLAQTSRPRWIALDHPGGVEVVGARPPLVDALDFQSYSNLCTFSAESFSSRFFRYARPARACVPAASFGRPTLFFGVAR